ncbi:MAG: TfoX/Sxy family protein [Chloroflexi bacterium]|nr:TfoX/Sxy family protein [Chloroflexota bacterium]
MPYNQQLAERLRQKLIPIVRADEKKMFGGIGFMVNGNMAVGVHKDYLIVRVGADQHSQALNLPGAKPFDITGKPMSGWIMVAQEGYSADLSLEHWITLALEFMKTLPPK